MTVRTKLLVDSDIFPDESSASYALSIFGVLSKPGDILLSGNKSYSSEDFPKYLIERCGVEADDTKTAIELLKEENLVELSRKVKIVKNQKKINEFGTKSY